MITIKQDENKRDAQLFLTQQGVYHDVSDDIVMTAKDKEEILAVGSLSLKEYKVFLDLAVPCEDMKKNVGFLLGLMKSLLNLADLRGIKTVYGSNPRLFDLYKLLRFQKETVENGNERYALNLEGYFTVDSCQHAE